MEQKIDPLTKFLLPIDGEGTYNYSCLLAGRLAKVLGSRINEITLLHVLGGRYLSSHMENIDIRAKLLIETEKFQRFREEFLQKKIIPRLQEAKALLENMDIKAPIDMEILDGKPSSVIREFAQKNKYSTIVMQRRCIDPVKGSFVGSVTSGILYSDITCSIYLPGTELEKGKSISLNKFLVPLDGSPGSFSALNEASILMKYVKDSSICLLHVLDVAAIAEAVNDESKPSPSDSIDDIFTRAKEILSKNNIPENRIEERLESGEPDKVIEDYSEKIDADIIFLGKSTRSTLGDIIIGSVGRAILGRCEKKTLAIVTE